MTSGGYAVLGFAVGLGLLWGYALLLWVHGRSLRRAELRRGALQPRRAGEGGAR